MNSKNRLQNRLRGWLPKEPTLSIRQKQPAPKTPYMIPWFATAAAVGVAVAASLVLLGNLFGFTVGYGAYFWYIEVGFAAWICAGFVAVYGYLRKRKAEGKT